METKPNPTKLVTITWSKTVVMPHTFDKDDASHAAMASSMGWMDLQPNEYTITKVEDK
jgi:hypothetical protein